jgi:hypothetical protein
MGGGMFSTRQSANSFSSGFGFDASHSAARLYAFSPPPRCADGSEETPARPMTGSGAPASS